MSLCSPGGFTITDCFTPHPPHALRLTALAPCTHLTSHVRVPGPATPREIGRAQREAVREWLEDFEDEEGESLQAFNRAKARGQAKRDAHRAQQARLDAAEAGSYQPEPMPIAFDTKGRPPRPEGAPTSTTLTEDQFQSVLVLWNTLQLCGADLLSLQLFPLDHIEQAVRGTFRGLCPVIVQECIHRMLSIILRERKDPTKPVTLAVIEEEYEEDEKRPIESLEAVVYRGIKSPEDLLPYGWQEVTRLLIAERFKVDRHPPRTLHTFPFPSSCPPDQA